MVHAGREKNQFLRAAGAPARGAAEPGPPRHAKIGKNGTVTVNDLNQRRYIKNLTWCLRFEQILHRIQMGRCHVTNYVSSKIHLMFRC